MAIPHGVVPGSIIACPSCQAQLAVPGAPVAQKMQDSSLEGILGPQKGLMVRQKLDQMEIILPLWEKRNKYKIAYMPDKPDKPWDEWDDQMFKKALKKNHLATAKEKSECCQRICCGPYREFTMKVKAGEDTGDEGGKLAEFERPFKCTCFCYFCYINPQQIIAKDKDDNVIGSVEQTFICPRDYFCTRHFEVKNAEGELDYYIRDNLCMDCNMCAPSLCFKVRTLEIVSKDRTEVLGTIRNIFPGCTLRSFFGDADNYVLEFPTDATVAQKTTLLAGNILLDFLLFERQQNDGGVQVDL